MAKVCVICQKNRAFGRRITRRGMARAKGGAGRKITGTSKRTFMPNLQRIKIINENGTPVKAYVCTGCIKAGKVKKA